MDGLVSIVCRKLDVKTITTYRELLGCEGCFGSAKLENIDQTRSDMGLNTSFFMTQQSIGDKLFGYIGEGRLVDSLLVHVNELFGELVQAAEKVGSRDGLSNTPRQGLLELERDQLLALHLLVLLFRSLVPSSPHDPVVVL